MGFVIAIEQEKGGVGKTTTIVNLAVAVALTGKKTIIIGLDPGDEVGDAVGAEVPDAAPTIEQVLKSGDLSKRVCPTRTENLFAVPGDRSSKAKKFDEEELNELLLTTALESLEDEFEFVFVDVKGGIDLMAQMAMYAADLVIVPCDRDGPTAKKASYTLDYARKLVAKRSRLLPHRRSVAPERFTKLVLINWETNRDLTASLERVLKKLPSHALVQTKIYRCEALIKSREQETTLTHYMQTLPPSKRTKEFRRAVRQFEQLANEVIDYAQKWSGGFARAGNA